MTRPLTAASATILLCLLAACGGGATSQPEAATSQPEAATTPPAASPAATSPAPAATKKSPDLPSGGYIDYADYRSDPQAYAAGDVVLFFNATWCPTCQEATGNLEGAQFPDGLTVVSVDYDANLQLRKEYGVTTQHTFIQVGPDGQELAKFTGATTVPQIEGELV